MIDEKETLQPNPEMLLIMFNQGFIEHLLLIIFNRLQRFWDNEAGGNPIMSTRVGLARCGKTWGTGSK
jgi:hypothetical protein